MLIGNYAIVNATIGHELGGITDPTRWYKGGSVQGFYCGDHLVSGQTEYASFPAGANPPQSFILAPKAGGMSSHNGAIITFTPSAGIAGGLPGSGSATITFTVDGTGGLIVSGSGSATITLAPSGTILSVAAGSGSATITFTPTATLGAEAGISGSASVTFSPTALISAIGYLAGLSTSETEFSASALAAAVWEAAAADYNTAGTMGEKLNDAGAAGNPWAALLADNNDPDTFGERVQRLLTVAKFLGLK